MNRNTLAGLLLVAGLAACTGDAGSEQAPDSTRTYTLSWQESGRVETVTLDSLEALGAKEVTSAYFDKALQYSNSRFRAVPFEALLRKFPTGPTDAVLLNCFDDYQGVISVTDIHRYQLQLATRIFLTPEVSPPDWLNPLLILVPDGTHAPFQERFLTANIRELSFVKLANYYRPLNQVKYKYPKAVGGLKKFKDNCVFCHSVKGVGGNKGGSLLEKFDFSKDAEHENFIDHFLAFHHKDNADKQNVEQFVDRKGLEEIGGFLQKLVR